jgi:predicted phosphodiesterase
VVHAGPRSDEAVPKFIRIAEGEAVVFGRCSDLQTHFFGYDRSVADRHVKISNREGDLKIQPLDPERMVALSAPPSMTGLTPARRERLMRLPAILGRALVTLDHEEALDKLREVNGAIAAEPYREQNEEGDPGGIIRFPDKMPVIIMGDIHARVDNVLRVLTEGDVLAALERSELSIVFLGDLVHSEATGELEDMTSSVLVFDLFCMLKLRFPKNVFYIHGNHESFSEDVGKGGVLQGLLFRKHLKKLRGKAYLKEMETLFDQLAYVAHGKNFAACHGAPVRSKVDRQTLVNIRRYPGLQYELVWNRLRQGNRPAGYGKGSVKRFRQTLGLPKQAPMIVAHNPQSEDGTLWLNVGDIEGHHIVYSARTERLAIMVISDGTSWPLELLPDPALAHLAP